MAQVYPAPASSRPGEQPPESAKIGEMSQHIIY